MAPCWDSNQGRKKKQRKENAGKHQRHRSKAYKTRRHKPTHVVDPHKNADTQTPSDAQIYNNRCLYNTEIKSWVHPAIGASQTQFPSDVWPPHIPRLFRVNDWGQYHHINIILCSPTPLPFLGEWLLSTGAYLRRDGKGTEERKSILYLTTKHNPNQKQLEFAGRSINCTASSGRPLCRWIAAVMHYSTMA